MLKAAQKEQEKNKAKNKTKKHNNNNNKKPQGNKGMGEDRHSKETEEEV